MFIDFITMKIFVELAEEMDNKRGMPI